MNMSAGLDTQGKKREGSAMVSGQLGNLDNPQLPPPPNWTTLSVRLSLAAVFIGAMALLGWILDVDQFKRLHAGLVTMKANTALCLILTGAAIVLKSHESGHRRRHRLADFLSFGVALVGILTLIEHVTGLDLHIDQIFFHESPEEAGRSFPGRMGPVSALNFLLLAVAIVGLDRGAQQVGRLARFCVGTVVVSTFIIFLGYFYSVELPSALAPYFSIAFHTVIAYFLLCAAMLAVRPNRGLIAEFIANDVSGTVARRILPTALLFPALLGWLCVLGRNAGWYGRGVGTAILASSVTLLLTWLVWKTTRVVSAVDAQRRRTESELRKSERELSDFFDNAAVALHWVGPDGTILRVNDAELRLLGYSREEYVGRNIAEFHVSQAAIQDILARELRGETITDFPVQLRCKDGAVKDVLIDSSGFWEGGKFAHTRCFTRDVTELKRVGAARFQLAAIVDSSDDAIISKDLQGHVTSWNASAARLFGYSAEEMVGQSIYRLIPPDRKAEEIQILASLRAGRRIEHFETIRVTKDGRQIAVSLTISPVRDNEGTIIGASKILRDVSARKQVEADLDQQRQWLAVTLSSIGDAVIATDAHGIVTFLNPVAEQLTEWSSGDPVGLPLHEVFQIVDEETGNTVPSPVDRVLGKHTALDFARHPALITKGLQRISIEENATGIKDEQGQIVGAVIVFRDVTEKRRAAEALRKAKDEAVSANRAKDAFLASLSHELRTPLTPVLMLSKAMEKSPHLDPEVREDFATIRKNVELEARIIDDLLDLTRITQGKLIFRTETVDPHLLIDDVLQILRDDLQAKRITVGMEFSAEHHSIRGDSVRLQQVLWNILKNAVKFTPEDGAITIQSWNDGPHLRLAVTDTGLGITAAELPLIFEAFVQGNEAAEPRFGGLGLGLSISALLVAKQDGKLWAESPGRDLGSTFYLEFPTVADAAINPTAHASPTQRADSLRILLVEDHVATRETLSRLLAQRGHVVESTGTVASGLTMATNGCYDLVISDLGLPDGGGHELMKAIRLTKQVPGIALSGYGMEEDVARSQAAGFAAHLTKPVDVQSLAEAIESVLRPGRVGDASMANAAFLR